jgi:hypothetical protein
MREHSPRADPDTDRRVDATLSDRMCRVEQGLRLVSRVRRDRDDGGGLDVTPFMLVERGIDTRGLSSVMLSPVNTHDDLLREVAVHYELPTAHSWIAVLDQLRGQTRMQPADVYLRFVPSLPTST